MRELLEFGFISLFIYEYKKIIEDKYFFIIIIKTVTIKFTEII